MKDLPFEVLMYIEKIKKFFNENETTKNYFITENNEEKFFDMLTSISLKVFEKYGDPTLSEKQFEFLRIIVKDYEIIDDYNIYVKTSKNTKIYIK